MASYIDVSIVVVSFNTRDLTDSCLKSIMQQRDLNLETFVVDNASHDGSAQFISTRHPWVHLIVNEKNRGFAAANNQVLPLCRGRYILFLNPDTVLTENCLNKAVEFMNSNSHVGLAGLHMVNPDGTHQESVSYRYPGQRYTSYELRGLPGKIAAVLGAAMIAPADIIKTVGGFDEDFFLYGEDQDLCLRIRKKGKEIGFIEGAKVIHLHGQSERNTPLKELWLKKLRAEYTFYSKHYSNTTVKKILRKEIIKTSFRLATLRAILPFRRSNKMIMEKIVKYQTTKEFLRNFKTNQKL
ncbi:MAG: glycosyltransferase family 2 protein [Syntrophales bacterium]|nr:glycosyltransferase family 2 protein [Syntrophales bacterium]